MGTGCAHTDDICGIVFDEVSNFRRIAAIHDPTGLCGLVEPFLDFRTEFVCGACSPVRSPMEGIQAGMRYIQQLGESTTQRRLPSRQGWVACQTVRVPFTTRSLTFPVPTRSTTVIARERRGRVHSLWFSIHAYGFVAATYHCCLRSVSCTSQSHHQSTVSDEQRGVRWLSVHLTWWQSSGKR